MGRQPAGLGHQLAGAVGLVGAEADLAVTAAAVGALAEKPELLGRVLILVGLAEGMTMGGQVWVQFIGVAATFAWCAVLTWIILKLIDVVICLRVDSDEETQGLDIVLHDETGYNL